MATSSPSSNVCRCTMDVRLPIRVTHVAKTRAWCSPFRLLWFSPKSEKVHHRQLCSCHSLFCLARLRHLLILVPHHFLAGSVSLIFPSDGKMDCHGNNSGGGTGGSLFPTGCAHLSVCASRSGVPKSLVRRAGVARAVLRWKGFWREQITFVGFFL